MTIASFKDKGVTVVTVAADSKSMLPPLCQILKSLCYSPMCCSAIFFLHRLLQQSTVSTIDLFTIQIMVGLFNIGLVPGRTYMYPKDLTSLGVAYWLGAVHIYLFCSTRLLTTMDITMIVLAVLQLCVCISFAVLGIKAVVNRQKEEGDVEDQQQQLNAVLLTNPCA
uniref:Uncharacterized protein n=1 Tax=Sander lucioperca TaxID=283035 RepID=A0A8C9YMP5_SANLU